MTFRVLALRRSESRTCGLCVVFIQIKQLIKPNYLVILPPTKKLAPFIYYLEKNAQSPVIKIDE